MLGRLSSCPAWCEHLFSAARSEDESFLECIRSLRRQWELTWGSRSNDLEPPSSMASGSCKRHAHLQQALCLLVSWVSSTHRSTNPNLKNRALGNSQWHTPHSDVCLVCFREGWAEVHPRRAFHSLHKALAPYRALSPISISRRGEGCSLLPLLKHGRSAIPA